MSKQIVKGYKRFANYLDLECEVRSSLVNLLKNQYGLEPSSDKNEIVKQTFDAASDFETHSLKSIRWEEMDQGVARQLVANAQQRSPEDLTQSEVIHDLVLSGVLWTERDAGIYYANAAGIILFAPDPSIVFPQYRFLADS